MYQKTFAFLILLLNVYDVKMENGLDASSAITSAQFQSFRAANYTFYIARLGRTGGTVDPNGVANIIKARQANFADVGAYIFPCTFPKCPTATKQVTNAISALQAQNASINVLWLDIEDPEDYWPKPVNIATNRKFINDMANAALNAGYNIGIYTGKYGWETICGKNFTDYSSYPLYWANYNKHADLTTGFVSFGGWSAAFSHQWDKNHKAYGVTFDPIVR